MSTPAETLAKLDEIEARANAASAAPWSPDTREPHDMVVWGAPDPSQEERGADGDLEHDGSRIIINIGEPIVRIGDVCGSPADTEFIAHAREDIPWLVAQLRDALRSLSERSGAEEDDTTPGKVELFAHLSPPAPAHPAPYVPSGDPGPARLPGDRHGGGR